MKTAVSAALLVVLAAGAARAQAPAPAPPGTAPAAQAPADAAEGRWSFSVAVSGYFLPDDPDYAQPAMTADRGRLHLEARYNYEDRDTGSAWVGYNLSVGDAVTLELTPLVGAVFGNTNGIAPGYRGSLAWRMLQLYSETEFVIDTGDSADSFLYTWSEFEVAPKDWCRFGLVVQRTKAYRTEFDIQRGFFAGASYRGASVTAYVFNPDADRPTFVVAVGVGF